MQVDTPPLLVSYSVLAITALITWANFLRQHSTVQLNIALMFSTLGMPACVLLSAWLIEFPKLWRDILIFIFAIAHPYTLLRLAHSFRELPKSVIFIARIGMVLALSSGIGLVVLSRASPWTSISGVPVFSYFVLIEGYTGWVFLQETRSGVGLNRRRLLFVAIGTGAFVAIFCLLLVFLIFPAVLNLKAFPFFLSALIVIVALSNYIGFTPPHPLRQIWQLHELRNFLTAIEEETENKDKEQVIAILNTAATRAVGGIVSTVATWDAIEKCLKLHPSPNYPEMSGPLMLEDGLLAQVWHTRTPSIAQTAADFSAEEMRLREIVKAEVLYIVPVKTHQHLFGLLLVFLSYHNLFMDDDIDLLSLFASHTATMLSYQVLLDNQHALVEHLLQNANELQAAHDMLETRVKERTAELRALNKELQQFAYVVSHDLRVPLVNLKGFSSELRFALEHVEPILAQVSPHLSTAQQQEMQLAFKEDIPEALEFIETSASRMDDLINALLKLSRLGRRELDLIEIDMDVLVADTLKTLAHQIEVKNVTVEVTPLFKIVADRTAMEQVMGNILSNAIAYLDPERPGKILVSGEQGATQATFHIQDNGRGIAPDDMDKVFAPFRRAGVQDVPGEGLGLPHVQAMLRRHGGYITCESELGVGTTFSFTIPRHIEVEE